MTGADLIVLLVIGSLVSTALWKLRRDKKSGVKCSGCAGCPVAKDCSGHGV